MAFPNDLSDVVVFKIHPAIGVARVANNDDFYVFGKDPGNYKSGKRIKRQAVQFRIFAYGDNHVGLGELTAPVMAALGIKAVWSARVANRKLAHYSNLPLGATDLVISAEASSDDANGGQLVGSLPTFAEGAKIPLGQITDTGLFIPPKGGVFRKTPGEAVPNFPARSTTVADTSCDGSISVRLTAGGRDLDTIPACILVAPQDFSPEVNPPSSLVDLFRRELQIPTSPAPGNLHNQTARALDEAAIATCTEDFQPGIEGSFAGSRSEITDLKGVFYRPSQDPRIDPREMRVRYRTAAGEPGAIPGQITSGLCSPWQGDYMACVGFWSENLPIDAFLDEDSSVIVQVFRTTYADHSPSAERLGNGDHFDQHVDEIGVVRNLGSKLVETERDPGDDIVL